MKEGWKYKKLGDITTSINGLWTGKKPPFVTVAVVRNTNFTKDCKLDMSNVAYLDVEEKQYVTRKLKSGDIIIEKSGGSDKQPVGRPVLFEISDGEYSFSNFTSTLRINDLEQLSPKFLHYSLYGAYLRGDTLKMQSKTTGIHNLDFKAYKNLLVPTPSIAEQKLTVEELDLLSSIIEKKKAQLKELDNLAQSLFYEMFGDPISNEKGWKVSKLGEICIFLQGEQVPIEEQSVIQHEGMVRFLRIIDFTQGNEPPRFVFCKDKKHILDNDEIAIVRYGSPGFVCYGKYGVIANNLFKIAPKDKDRFEFRYLIAWLSSDAFQSVVNGNQYGAALQAIKFGTIKDIPFIQPPLSIQQQFASKIETIEHQKEFIKQSIKEVETLFNSRMDYYFN